MPAGSELAGIGLAGPGAYQTEGTALVLSAPTLQASFYDPSIRDFRLITGGYFASIHPVDQEAILALTIPLGSIPSSPTVGSRFAEIRWIGRTIKADAERLAKVALQAPLRRGDIEYLGTSVATIGRDWLYIDVDYRNLLLDPTRAARKSTTRIPSSLAA